MSEHDSDSIIGLTLAELAFFMLLVVLLLAHLRAAPGPPGIPPAVHEALEQKLAAAQEEIARLGEELEDKRSAWRPACDENLPLNERLLFTVVIQGQNSFRILPRTTAVSLDEVRQIFSSDLRQAETEGCVHSIASHYDQALSTEEYVVGRGRLAQDFYIADRGAGR